MPAAAQEMCAGLNRIAAAAREPLPFASLDRAREEIVPGLGNHCWIATVEGQRTFVCSRGQFAPASLEREALGPMVRDCLGAERLPARHFDSTWRYRTPDLVVTVGSHCNERCHVGRSAMLTFRRRAAGDAAQAPDSR